MEIDTLGSFVALQKGSPCYPSFLGASQVQWRLFQFHTTKQYRSWIRYKSFTGGIHNHSIESEAKADDPFLSGVKNISVEFCSTVVTLAILQSLYDSVEEIRVYDIQEISDARGPGKENLTVPLFPSRWKCSVITLANCSSHLLIFSNPCHSELHTLDMRIIPLEFVLEFINQAPLTLAGLTLCDLSAPPPDRELLAKVPDLSHFTSEHHVSPSHLVSLLMQTKLRLEITCPISWFGSGSSSALGGSSSEPRWN